MYLAGFYPKDSVQTMRVFKGITAPFTEWEQGKFHADRHIDYTIDALIADKGARTPSVATSQKEFKVLVVALTDAPLSTTEWSNIESDAQWFAQQSDDGNDAKYNFWEATKGIGTVVVDNLHRSLLGAVSPIAHVQRRTQNAVQVQVQSGVLHFSQSVQGYRLMRVNGVLLAHSEGNQIRSVALGSSVSAGVYLVKVKVDGVWQSGRSLTVR